MKPTSHTDQSSANGAQAFAWPMGPLRSGSLACLVGAALAMPGCGGTAALHQPEGMPSTATLHGKVRGGQQPVSGAEIRLYSAGSTGYGEGAQPLTAAVYSDTNGDFAIAADFTCPSPSTPVYLLASGGNPGIGKDNPAISLMAAIGPCGDVGSKQLVIDEVTTIASVWSLAPFLSASGTVGTSAGNARGLANAFAGVNSLADISKGIAPGPAAPSAASVPAGKLNTLANILAACVNSPGSTCAALFRAATPPGGSAPANTLQAALNIARHPGAAVAALFAIPTPIAPFEPSLASAPTDWLLGISYGGGGLDSPGSLSIDGSGNVWVANYFGSVSEFSPAGEPLSPAQGFTGGGLSESYGLAVSSSGAVWTTNEISAQANGGHGTITVMSAAGQVTSGPAGYFGGGVFYPVAIAADSDGSMWAANYGNSTATKLAGSGAPISGSGGFGANKLIGPVAVALDASHNAWFANQSASSGSVTSISQNGSRAVTYACCGEEPSGIATDSVGVAGNISRGHVWTADYATSTVGELELRTDGSVSVVSAGYAGGGLNHPNGVAVDGAGNVWLTNFDGSSVTELTGAAGAAGRPLSPAVGFAQDLHLYRPYAVAIDASGNVWVSNFGSSKLTELVGAAMPVSTPLVGPARLP